MGVAVVSSAVLMKMTKPPEVTVTMNQSGLKSLKSDDVEFLENGAFKVEQVLLKKRNGATYVGPAIGTLDFDQERQELTDTLPWGTIKIGYRASGNKLTLTMTTTNSSGTETIQGLYYIPLTLRFPEKVKEYDGSTPLLMHNVGQVAAVKVSYGSGTLAVVSEDNAKPLMVGFPWATNRPDNTKFPLSVHTGRVNSYPDSYPTINRPITPGNTDTYVVTLRFGRADAAENKLAGDAYEKFAETFPAQLNWPDRRAIGAIFLASAQENRSSTNPRGWFGDASLNVTTPAGEAEFRKRILSVADESIRIMREMHAQGAVTWDPEGQEFSHATSYIGDPRLVDTLAPEMTPVVDEYFDRFRKAGFRVGICIRPQSLRLSADKRSAAQESVSDPTQLLIDKIAYAKKRWGVSLVYLDSNTNPTDPNALDASIVAKVAAAFPDCLLIPEHSNLRYYSYSIPYAELRHGQFGTLDSVHRAYPNASSLIYTADGPLDLYHAELASAVKRGDILMYRTWYPDPQNEKVKSLYKP